MKTLKIISLVLSLMLVAVLAACVQTTPSDPSVISGRVQNYTGGAATLKALSLDGTTTLATGNLGANGDFSLDLPDTLEASALQTIQRPCAEVTMTSETFRGTGIAALYIVQDGKQTGFLSRASSLEATSGKAGKVIVWTYSDQTITIKGTCPGSDGLPSATYDIKHNKGWNLDEYDISTNAGVRTVTTTDLPWLFVENQPAPTSLIAPTR